jgi:hypothetical protein
MELTYGHCIQSLLAKRVKLRYIDDDRGVLFRQSADYGFSPVAKGHSFPARESAHPSNTHNQTVKERF